VVSVSYTGYITGRRKRAFNSIYDVVQIDIGYFPSAFIISNSSCLVSVSSSSMSDTPTSFTGSWVDLSGDVLSSGTVSPIALGSESHYMRMLRGPGRDVQPYLVSDIFPGVSVHVPQLAQVSAKQSK